MKKSIRVLICENSERDRAMLERHLTTSGYSLTTDCVFTAQTFKAALMAFEWDIIICDYSMHGFNAPSALKILHDSGLDIPFIIISGSIGEETAVEAMLSGANDYLPKDNLKRLIPAIERELQEAENRRSKRQADKERKIINDIIQGITAAPSLDEFYKVVHNSISQIMYAENCFVMIHDPLSGLNHYEFWIDKFDPRPAPQETDKGFSNYVLISGKPLLLTKDLLKDILKSGKAELIGSPAPSWIGVPLPTPSRTIGVLVLQHYQIENAFVQSDLDFLGSVANHIALAIERKRAVKLLSESEERYRELVENAIDIIYTHDLDGNYTSVNAAVEAIMGYSREEALSMNLKQTVAPEDLDYASKMIVDKLAGKHVTAYEIEIIAKDGHRVRVEVNTRINYENGLPIAVQGIARDITDRRRQEEARLAFERKYQDIFDLAPVGIYQSSKDGKILTANSALAKMLGYESTNELLSQNIGDLYFDQSERDKLIEEYKNPGYAVDVEIKWKRKDGSPIWIQLTAHVSKESNLEQQFFEGFVRDVTEHKYASEALRESSEKFRQLADNITDVFWIRSIDMQKVHYISPAFEKIWGRSLESLFSAPDRWLDFVLPEDRDRVSSAFANIDGKNLEMEYRISRPDGQIRWIRTRAFPVRDNDEKLISYAGIVTDITESKKADQALRDSEASNRAILESALDSIVVIDHEGNITEFNPAAEQTFGYSRSEVLGREMAEIIIPPKMRELHRRGMKQFIATGKGSAIGKRLELTAIRKNQDEFPIELTIAHIIGTEPPQFTGFIRDITERKKADEALRQSENRFRTIVDTEPECVKLVAADGTLLEMNPAGLRMIEADSFNDVKNYNISKLVVEEHREAFRNLTKRVFRGESAKLEFQIIGLNGTRRWMDSHATPLRDANGKITALLGISRDVTERKQSDVALKESEEKYRTILENIEDGYFEVDIAGNFTFFNDAICETIGIQREELMGSNNRDFMDMHNSELVYQTFNEVFRTGKPAKGFDWEITRPDGSHRVIEASISRRDDGSGKPVGFRGLVRDVTDRKNLEEQFRQSQKMEAIGVLAGGIAHDFNNLLTAINGYSDLVLRQLSSDDPIKNQIMEIRSAGERAATLTSQLLAFSRKQILKPRVHNLNSVIVEIEKMLRRIIRENIELRTVLASDLGNIRADSGQIEQVIMNLTVNARDAMPDGGTLIIETQNYYLGEDYVSQNMAVTPGNFVRLSVSDTGEGMSEETQRRIFDPFFTTKEVGKGTGLGLSTVYGIVKQSGGDIMVYSEPNKGTTFKIYLPCVDEAVQNQIGSDKDKQSIAGTETILLVEDEEIVRHLVREILSSSGYNVLVANSGSEAISLVETYQDPIHLLLTDVIMPNMDGPELQRIISIMKPDIKILFMSGYTDDAISQSGILNPEASFIEKPFTPDKLTRKIRNLLSA